MAGNGGLASNRSRLPAEFTTFVGRREELAQLKRLLLTTRLVTLTGAGGAGKTRLAVRVAADLRRAFVDGVWLVDLAPVTDEGWLELAVSETLGVVDQTECSVSEALIRYLRDRELLLVLDGCEHLLDACARFVSRILAAAPAVRIICTSRQSLGTVSEWVWPVPPLPVPDPEEKVPRDRETAYAAVALFLARASGAAPGFELTADNRQTVIDICRRLDGLPLALELAAAQLRCRSIDQLAEGLSDRFSLLTVRHAVPAHHQTLRATMDWTFTLCSPAEQALWARVSVFHDDFDLAAAGYVCDGDGQTAEELLDLFSGLVDKSIVVRQPGDGPARYRLLETMREYGLQLLRAGGEAAEAGLRRRHRDWYLRLAREFDAEWFGPRQREWLARIRNAYANLRAALDFSLTCPGEAAVGQELAAHLGDYWQPAGLLHEGTYWLQRALGAVAGSPEIRGAAVAALSRISFTRGDLPSARACAAELHTLAQRCGSGRLRALASNAIGMSAMVDGDLATARTELEVAVAGFTEVGDFGIDAGLAETSLALTTAFLGDPDTAMRICQKCMARNRSHQDRWWLSNVYSSAAHIAFSVGDREAATENTRKALELAQPLDGQLIIAVGLERSGWFAGALGDHEGAACLLGAADQIWKRLGRVMFGAQQWLRGHHACEAAARAALGDDRYEATFRAGAALTAEEAVAYALDNDRRPARAVERGAAVERDEPVGGSVLTPRQRQVAELVAHGLSNREIAARLVTSPRTAESHVENILRKLGFTSRAQVASWIVDQRQGTD